MAYFIVIGTDNKVKNVVDEILKSHPHRHSISSGCIVMNDNGEMSYLWKSYDGKEKEEDKKTYTLEDALSNHIANFKTILPPDASPNIMIVCNCIDEKEEILEYLVDALFKTAGTTFAAFRLDIALIGYDMHRPGDVTIRPRWRNLKRIKELLDRNKTKANLLYINNIDYFGAATNIDIKLLGRFLAKWESICEIRNNCKDIQNVFSIGIAEYQYNFEDIVRFFSYDTEYRIIDRQLNATPSKYTQRVIEKHYCHDIDLTDPRLDGLRQIFSLWEPYFETKFNYSATIDQNPYCLQTQTKAIAKYLNYFLKVYVNKKKEEKKEISVEFAIKKKNLKEAESKLESLKQSTNQEENKDQFKNTSKDLNEEIIALRESVNNLEKKIKELSYSIDKNTYYDADDITKTFNQDLLITAKQRNEFNKAVESCCELEEYLKKDEAAEIILEVISKYSEDCNSSVYPWNPIASIGILQDVSTKILPTHIKNSEDASEKTINTASLPKEKNRSGCNPIGWLMRIIKKHSSNSSEYNSNEGFSEMDECRVQDNDLSKSNINNSASFEQNDKSANDTSCVSEALRTIREDIPQATEWWNKLCSLIRQQMCKHKYLKEEIENYKVPNNKKSISLISMRMVDEFRKEDILYKQSIESTIKKWFDEPISETTRPKLNDLIEKTVIDPLREKYSIVIWTEGNPFFDVNLSDQKLEEIINDTYSNSKPFVEYTKISGDTIKDEISEYFFFGNPKIETKHIDFRNKYKTNSHTVCPTMNEDLTNSLSYVQIINISNCVDDVKDFKPRRENIISGKPVDPKFDQYCHDIIGDAQTPKDISRKIYDWLCDNIQYDTTLTIHDANACWKTKKGVCQAYCDLFCHIADTRGVVSEIIIGRTKTPDGSISKNLHSWLFVYTEGYDGILIDPTWGAGGVDDGRFTKGNNRELWFNVDPAWMIFTHLPDKIEMEKLEIEIDEEKFKKLPFLFPDKEKVGLDELGYYLDQTKELL